MKSAGYIKLYRKVFDNKRLFPKPYTEGVAWLWLLCFAAYNDMTVEVKSRNAKVSVQIKRGELAGSYRFLAEKFSWKIAEVETFLRYLKKENMITTELKNNITIISIINYEYYQGLLEESVLSSDAKTDTKSDINSDAKLTNNQGSYASTSDINSDATSDTKSDNQEEYIKEENKNNIITPLTHTRTHVHTRESEFWKSGQSPQDKIEEEKSSAKKEEENPFLNTTSFNHTNYTERLFKIMTYIANSDDWKDFIKSKGISTAQSKEWLHEYYDREKLVKKHSVCMNDMYLLHEITSHITNFVIQKIEIQQRASQSNKPKTHMQRVAEELKAQGLL
ncbi:MAG: hypothetical protein IJ180_00690 [Bacteroidales bacterium]|nr:hypothetical protein [Bacteroidales bacterium]